MIKFVGQWIKRIRAYDEFYRISGGLALVIVGIWIGSLLFRDGYATNLYTELLSVIATVAVLDQINQWRDRQALKTRLKREAVGQSNEIAKTAIDWMRAEGWLTTSDRSPLLKQFDLSHAQLERANLIEADLAGSTFKQVNLDHAYVQWADFSGADMPKAYIRQAFMSAVNLQNATLREADLRGSELWSANLAGADLTGARLEGVVLSNANLRHATLADCTFDTDTVLPDAVRVSHSASDGDRYDKYWSAAADMARYTDPSRPDFWEPGYLKQGWDKQTFLPHTTPEWIQALRREHFGD